LRVSKRDVSFDLHKTRSSIVETSIMKICYKQETEAQRGRITIIIAEKHKVVILADTIAYSLIESIQQIEEKVLLLSSF
jgi:hypothetical protein